MHHQRSPRLQDATLDRAYEKEAIQPQGSNLKVARPRSYVSPPPTIPWRPGGQRCPCEVIPFSRPGPRGDVNEAKETRESMLRPANYLRSRAHLFEAQLVCAARGGYELAQLVVERLGVKVAQLGPTSRR